MTVADPDGDFVTALGPDVPVQGYPVGLGVKEGQIEAVDVGPFHSVAEVEEALTLAS